MKEETLITTLSRAKSVSIDDVAEWTGLKRETIQRLARTGRIPGAFQPAGKWGAWQFKRKELEAWWQSLGN
jgi:excisionase family DNA binding protein